MTTFFYELTIWDLLKLDEFMFWHDFCYIYNEASSSFILTNESPGGKLWGIKPL